LALTGIAFFAIMYGITDYAGFITRLTFWILEMKTAVDINNYLKYKKKLF